MMMDAKGESLCSGGARHNRAIKGRSPRYARDTLRARCDGMSYVGLGLGPAAYLAYARDAEGASTVRYAPSIMTSSGRPAKYCRIQLLNPAYEKITNECNKRQIAALRSRYPTGTM